VAHGFGELKFKLKDLQKQASGGKLKIVRKIRIRKLDFKPINIIFLLDGRRRKIACTHCKKMGMALRYRDVSRVETACCGIGVDLDADTLIRLLPLKREE